MTKSDKIGELWSELQRTEERLRTVGGGASGPGLDCFVSETLKDPFDATIYTTLSDAELRDRIGASQASVAAMAAAVIADIDGQSGASISPLFGRSRAALAPMAVVEGPHSQWTPAAPPAPAATPATASLAEKPAPAQAQPVLNRQASLAQTAAEAKRKATLARTHKQTTTDALSLGGASLGDNADAAEPPVAAAKATAKAGRLQSASDALETGALNRPDPMPPGPDMSEALFESAVPEPRAHRDLPSAVRVDAAQKIKPLKKKRPLWLRILWG